MNKEEKKVKKLLLSHVMMCSALTALLLSCFQRFYQHQHLLYVF